MMECQFGQYLFRLVQEIRPDAGVSGITEYTHPLPPASDLIGTVRDPSAGFGLLMHRRARASMLLPLRISFSTLVNATTWRRDSSAHLRDEEFLKAFHPGTLPNLQCRHADHLRSAWLHMHRSEDTIILERTQLDAI